MTDRNITVTNSSAGALVAGIIAVLVIALAVWYFGFRPNTDDGAGAGANIETSVETTAAP